MGKHPGPVAAVTGALVAAALAGCAPPGGQAPTAASGPATAAAPTGAAHTVVTIGDSIMAGYGLPAGAAWPELLAQQSGLDVVNLACSGAGFTAVGACGTDFDGLVSEAVRAAPDVVIIQSSDNDEAATPEEIRSATASTVADLHRALPTARIIGLSTLWNDHAGAPASIGAATAALKDAVDAADGTFVDIGQPLAGNTGLLQGDDEHPTTAGQEALLHQINGALDASGVVL